MVAAKLALAVFAASIALPVAAQQPVPGGAVNANLGDMNYGVCRGPDPKCFHDWPRAKTTHHRALLYTRTAGSRHASLGAPLPAGMNPALAPDNVVQREMLRLAEANGFTLDYTEDPSQMTRLGGYNAVIFFSTSRDNLNDEGKIALRQYMRAGGGFVGIHSAVGTLSNWPYFEGLLGGAGFFDHAAERKGDVVVVDSRDASTKGLPTRFPFKDEWFDLVPFPTHVRFLATVDEQSWPPTSERSDEYAPRAGGAGAAPGQTAVVGRSPGHGKFHPVAWCQYYDGGKVWVTTLGHSAANLGVDVGPTPGAKEFQTLVIGGIKSVMGMDAFCR